MLVCGGQLQASPSIEGNGRVLDAMDMHISISPYTSSPPPPSPSSSSFPPPSSIDPPSCPDGQRILHPPHSPILHTTNHPSSPHIHPSFPFISPFVITLHAFLAFMPRSSPYSPPQFRNSYDSDSTTFSPQGRSVIVLTRPSAVFACSTVHLKLPYFISLLLLFPPPARLSRLHQVRHLLEADCLSPVMGDLTNQCRLSHLG